MKHVIEVPQKWELRDAEGDLIGELKFDGHRFILHANPDYQDGLADDFDGFTMPNARDFEQVAAVISNLRGRLLTNWN